jgi:hypothetical protein
MIPVKGHPNLYRDDKTGAILNYDNISYNQHLESLHRRDVQKKEIEKLKTDIEEIKSLLKEIVNRSNIDL